MRKVHTLVERLNHVQILVKEECNILKELISSVEEKLLASPHDEVLAACFQSILTLTCTFKAHYDVTKELSGCLYIVYAIAEACSCQFFTKLSTTALTEAHWEILVTIWTENYIQEELVVFEITSLIKRLVGGSFDWSETQKLSLHSANSSSWQIKAKRIFELYSDNDQIIHNMLDIIQSLSTLFISHQSTDSPSNRQKYGCLCLHALDILHEKKPQETPRVLHLISIFCNGVCLPDFHQNVINVDTSVVLLLKVLQLPSIKAQSDLVVAISTSLSYIITVHDIERIIMNVVPTFFAQILKVINESYRNILPENERKCYAAFELLHNILSLDHVCGKLQFYSLPYSLELVAKVLHHYYQHQQESNSIQRETFHLLLNLICSSCSLTPFFVTRYLKVSGFAGSFCSVLISFHSDIELMRAYCEIMYHSVHSYGLSLQLGNETKFCEGLLNAAYEHIEDKSIPKLILTVVLDICREDTTGIEAVKYFRGLPRFYEIIFASFDQYTVLKEIENDKDLVNEMEQMICDYLLPLLHIVNTPDNEILPTISQNAFYRQPYALEKAISCGYPVPFPLVVPNGMSKLLTFWYPYVGTEKVNKTLLQCVYFLSLLDPWFLEPIVLFPHWVDLFVKSLQNKFQYQKNLALIWLIIATVTIKADCKQQFWEHPQALPLLFDTLSTYLDDANVIYSVMLISHIFPGIENLPPIKCKQWFQLLFRVLEKYPDPTNQILSGYLWCIQTTMGVPGSACNDAFIAVAKSKWDILSNIVRSTSNSTECFVHVLKLIDLIPLKSQTKSGIERIVRALFQCLTTWSSAYESLSENANKALELVARFRKWFDIDDYRSLLERIGVEMSLWFNLLQRCPVGKNECIPIFTDSLHVISTHIVESSEPSLLNLEIYLYSQDALWRVCANVTTLGHHFSCSNNFQFLSDCFIFLRYFVKTTDQFTFIEKRLLHLLPYSLKYSTDMINEKLDNNTEVKMEQLLDNILFFLQYPIDNKLNIDQYLLQPDLFSFLINVCEAINHNGTFSVLLKQRFAGLLKIWLLEGNSLTDPTKNCYPFPDILTAFHGFALIFHFSLGNNEDLLVAIRMGMKTMSIPTKCINNNQRVWKAHIIERFWYDVISAINQCVANPEFLIDLLTILYDSFSTLFSHNEIDSRSFIFENKDSIGPSVTTLLRVSQHMEEVSVQISSVVIGILTYILMMWYKIVEKNVNYPDLDNHLTVVHNGLNVIWHEIWDMIFVVITQEQYPFLAETVITNLLLLTRREITMVKKLCVEGHSLSRMIASLEVVVLKIWKDPNAMETRLGILYDVGNLFVLSENEIVIRQYFDRIMIPLVPECRKRLNNTTENVEKVSSKLIKLCLLQGLNSNCDISGVTNVLDDALCDSWFGYIISDMNGILVISADEVDRAAVSLRVILFKTVELFRLLSHDNVVVNQYLRNPVRFAQIWELFSKLERLYTVASMKAVGLCLIACLGLCTSLNENTIVFNWEFFLAQFRICLPGATSESCYFIIESFLNLIEYFPIEIELMVSIFGDLLTTVGIYGSIMNPSTAAFDILRCKALTCASQLMTNYLQSLKELPINNVLSFIVELPGHSCSLSISLNLEDYYMPGIVHHIKQNTIETSSALCTDKLCQAFISLGTSIHAYVSGSEPINRVKLNNLITICKYLFDQFHKQISLELMFRLHKCLLVHDNTEIVPTPALTELHVAVVLIWCNSICQNSFDVSDIFIDNWFSVMKTLPTLSCHTESKRKDIAEAYCKSAQWINSVSPRDDATSRIKGLRIALDGLCLLMKLSIDKQEDIDSLRLIVTTLHEIYLELSLGSLVTQNIVASNCHDLLQHLITCFGDDSDILAILSDLYAGCTFSDSTKADLFSILIEKIHLSRTNHSLIKRYLKIMHILGTVHFIDEHIKCVINIMLSNKHDCEITQLCCEVLLIWELGIETCSNIEVVSLNNLLQYYIDRLDRQRTLSYERNNVAWVVYSLYKFLSHVVKAQTKFPEITSFASVLAMAYKKLSEINDTKMFELGSLIDTECVLDQKIKPKVQLMAAPSNPELPPQDAVTVGKSEAANPSTDPWMLRNSDIVVLPNLLDINVYKGKWRCSTQVAVKVNRSKPHIAETEIANEVKLLSSLRHPRIVTLIGYCDGVVVPVSDSGTVCDTKYPALILEYMDKGNLHTVLTNEHSIMSWQSKLIIAMDICEGMRFLHDSKVSHRSLTSENVLVDSHDRAKLIGLKHDTTSFKELTTECVEKDIIAFGHILQALITGKVSLKKGNSNKVTTLEQDHGSVGAVMDDLLTRCLCKGNTELPTFAETYETLHTLYLQETRRGFDQQRAIPDGFICPITQDVMKNPVILLDGHSYERKAIEDWLTRSQRSPLTNEILQDNTIIIENFALKSAIEAFMKSSSGECVTRILKIGSSRAQGGKTKRDKL